MVYRFYTVKCFDICHDQVSVGNMCYFDSAYGRSFVPNAWLRLTTRFSIAFSYFKMTLKHFWAILTKKIDLKMLKTRPNKQVPIFARINWSGVKLRYLPRKNEKLLKCSKRVRIWFYDVFGPFYGHFLWYMAPNSLVLMWFSFFWARKKLKIHLCGAKRGTEGAHMLLKGTIMEICVKFEKIDF